jgi:hypothetical protein
MAPKPTREPQENEDKFTQIYQHGEFFTYLPKGTKLKAFAAQMKQEGYEQTGFTIGGMYMKVNFNRKAVL